MPRLMNEARPTAFVVAQAGGAAGHGVRRIVPARLHERAGVIIGSMHEAERVAARHAEAG